MDSFKCTPEPRSGTFEPSRRQFGLSWAEVVAVRVGFGPGFTRGVHWGLPEAETHLKNHLILFIYVYILLF